MSWFHNWDISCFECFIAEYKYNQICLFIVTMQMFTTSFLFGTMHHNAI